MKNNFTSIKERVIKIAENIEISKEKFFTGIGMTSANFRGKAKETPLNSNAIENIITTYPEINLHWLITGMGDMFLIESKTLERFDLITDRNIQTQRVPLYNLEAIAGLVPLFNNPNDTVTEEYISIPNLPKCDGALTITGDSMYPLLKSGDIVAYKQIRDFSGDVFWGEMYLISIEIADEEYISVKYVQKSERGEEYIKLVSQNQHHQSKNIHLSKVRAMALIKASIRINSMG